MRARTCSKRVAGCSIAWRYSVPMPPRQTPRTIPALWLLSDRRTDAALDAGRHDLGLDPCRAQRLKLLAASTEDERVATLQADDAPVRPTQRHQQIVDQRLGR